MNELKNTHAITGRPYSLRLLAFAGLLFCSAGALAAAAPVSVLTAGFESVPERHDGSTAFVVELSFNSSMARQTRVKVTSSLAVTGANLVSVISMSSGTRDRWRVTVEPTSEAAVTLSLPADSDCESAPCSVDGLTLLEGVSVTIPGP